MPLLNQPFVIPSASAVGQSVCVTYQLVWGDDIRESEETFSVIVSSENPNDMISGVSSVTITIPVDNDSECMRDTAGPNLS